jgi:LPXTG-motif cell wall-anchored protein
VNLSVKKLRRSATVLGGSMLGLGLAAALATPALACNSTIVGTPSPCVNADGSWSITWTLTSDERGVSGTIISIDTTPDDAPIVGFSTDTSKPAENVIPALHHGALTGVQTLKGSDKTASVEIVASYTYNGKTFAAKADSNWYNQPTEVCHQSTPPTTKPTTTPPTTAPTTAPTTKPTPTTTASAPEKTPGIVYKDTCTTFTVGLDVPNTWKESETVTFTPSTGAAKTVTAKPGEVQTVDFPASKNLTVKASAVGGEKSLSIPYKAPADCSSPAPSSSGPVLAITGSSSAPLAGGAIALVLVGGGAFFLTRRRKMKFTA